MLSKVRCGEKSYSLYVGWCVSNNLLETMFGVYVGVRLVGGVCVSEWTIADYDQQQLLWSGRSLSLFSLNARAYRHTIFGCLPSKPQLTVSPIGCSPFPMRMLIDTRTGGGFCRPDVWPVSHAVISKCWTEHWRQPGKIASFQLPSKLYVAKSYSKSRWF